MSGPPPAPPPSDAALVGRALEHDEQAWDLLLERYGDYIYAIALRGFRLKPLEAEEVFQETVLAVYKNLSAFRGEGSLRAWIGQITQNAARAYLRRLGRRAEVPPIPRLPIRPRKPPCGRWRRRCCCGRRSIVSPPSAARS